MIFGSPHEQAQRAILIDRLGLDEQRQALRRIAVLAILRSLVPFRDLEALPLGLAHRARLPCGQVAPQQGFSLIFWRADQAAAADGRSVASQVDELSTDYLNKNIYLPR